jgi:hypothetical protein
VAEIRKMLAAYEGQLAKRKSSRSKSTVV